MAKITESYLRNLIKEELQKILSESDRVPNFDSFEKWLKPQMSQERYNKLKLADKETLQNRYKQAKAKKEEKEANPLSPEQQATEDARESNRIFRQSSRYSR